MSERAPSGSVDSEVLAGGGEMGALMRQIDWAKTPAGPVEMWPQSLRTVLGILLSSEHPIFVWWGQELVQFYNDGYRPILGSTKHPVAMGQRGRECWKEIWDVIAPMIDKVFAGGATYTKDGLLVLDRHGFLEECYFNYAYSPIRGEAGDVAGIFVACSETSGRVIGERRLKTLGELAAGVSEARSQDEACREAADVLSSATSDIPFALLYLLEEGGTKARLVQVVGLDAAHRLGPPAITLDDDAGAVWPLRSALQGEVLLELPTTEGLPGGPWPEPSTQAVVLPLEASGGSRPNGFLVAGASPRLPFDDAYRGFLRLVAGHVASAIRSGRAYEEEKRRAEALAELDSAKTAFFSNVSHEFRTPLTLMLGPIEDALADAESPLAPAQRERLEMVRRNGLRLQKLVNALLDFSRIGAGRMQARREPLDLAAVTAALAATFESLVYSAGMRLVVRCPALPSPVWVDPSMWETVVLNLLSNAFKFTLAGEIGVALRWKGERVELSVTDTGTGIGEEDQERIFERFQRVDGAVGRSDEGSGIGLSLVRELVKLHGGDISVRSAKGEGSEFTVSLPTGPGPASTPPSPTEQQEIASPQQAHAFVHEAEQWLARSSPEHSQDLDVSRTLVPRRTESLGHVLLADDNADMRVYLSRLLEPRFTVESVADGHAAVAAARARLPDLVLSDVMMSGLDGFGLVRALKDDPVTAAVPIILISARAGEEATLEGLAAGVADYIVKPFSARELLARVEAAVKAAQAQVERARLLQEAELLSEQLRVADQRKNEFLAMLAHELRNPMAAISLALTLLENVGNDPSKSASHRETARRQMRHLVRLVDDLLDVSRITRGKVELRKERANIASALQNAMTVARPVIEARRLDVSIDVSSGPFGLLADPTRLEQVIVNLLTNAAKYTEPGGSVRVRLERETLNGVTHAVLSVRDTGRGIPQTMLETIFDLFVQVAPNKDGTTGGLGLGLTVVRGLVEMHGGSVFARSEGPGTGSEFVVRLPLGELESAADATAEGTNGSREQADAAPKLRLVLVEDSEDVRDMLRECLLDLGHDVEVAANGTDGVAKVLDARPDVVLVDVGLPYIDGYEVARRVRAAPGGDAFFMIALTGYGGPEAKAEAQAAGFDLHLTKPVDLDVLQGILMRARDRAAGSNRTRGKQR